MSIRMKILNERKLRIYPPSHLLLMIPRAEYEDTHPLIHEDGEIDVPPGVFTLLVEGDVVLKFDFDGQIVTQLDQAGAAAERVA